MKRYGVQLRVIWLSICMFVLVVASHTNAKEQISITLQYRQHDAGAAVTAEWIEEFGKLHPAIGVTWQPMTGNWEDKLLTEMLAGTAPDVFEFWSSFNQRLRQQGLLLDLTPYTKRDFTEQDIADFFPSVWETSFTRFGPQAGSQYIMPRYINIMTFHYNVDRFLAAGLPDPSELDMQGEWTWDTLRESALELTRRDSQQVTQYGAMLSSQSLPRVLNWIWGAGGDLLDAQNPRRFVADTPAAEEGIQFLCNMMWEDGIAAPSFGHAGFLNGTIPIIEEGMQVVFGFMDTIGDAFTWDSIRRPAGPAGRPGYLVDDSFGIWVDTPHPEEAWQLLKFLVSREGQEIMVKHSLLPPVRRSAAPTYLKLAPDHNLSAFIDAVADSQPTVYSRMQGDISRINSALWEMLRSVLNNTQPYRVAVEAYRPRIEALLAEASH